ncbi:hypothetical protein B0H16DRAFT_382829 [Mycena metata]|uniref:Secreted protein n=1 Tax=Mycena metata TaxID=1033252 RepID=A0AAD7HHI0_9AGAR|nr:hypothetical protein B0H16DRAFT_563111 [Mycena metata]KAJ7720704.1 hypothetical protein B0H16DRAFT_382829 [Mycena metata]
MLVPVCASPRTRCVSIITFLPLFLVAALRLGCPSPSRLPVALRFGSAAPFWGSGCSLSGVGFPQSRVALAAGCPREFRLPLPGVAFMALSGPGASRSVVSHFPELLSWRSRGRERHTAACGRVGHNPSIYAYSFALHRHRCMNFLSPPVSSEIFLVVQRSLERIYYLQTVLHRSSQSTMS